MRFGMGQDDQYDCSGLFISAASEVLNTDISVWPANLRHTRQLWKAAGEPLATGSLGGLEAGTALVSVRWWGDEQCGTWVPAHMGLLVRATSDGPITVQAQASHESRVVERLIRRDRVEYVIGSINYPQLFAAVGRA